MGTRTIWTIGHSNQSLEAFAGLLAGNGIEVLADVRSHPSEGDPRGCHRRLLVGKVLAERGVELRHILRDGTVAAEREVPVEPPWRSPQPVAHRRRPRP
jgi:uncharacterized protein (DUF488 family)